MKIKMIKDVRSDLPFLSTPGTVLRFGKVYEATANKLGAVSGKCENGEMLGVRPGEFEFVSMPKWLYDKWASAFPWAVNGATIEEGDVEK